MPSSIDNSGRSNQWIFVTLPQSDSGLCGGTGIASTGSYTLGNHTIAITGGSCRQATGGERRPTSNGITLDLRSGSTSPLPPMRHGRARHSITALHQSLIACGGEREQVNVNATIKPVANVLHIAAVNENEFMTIMSNGQVYFWNDHSREWRLGPGLPYRPHQLGLAVIED